MWAWNGNAPFMYVRMCCICLHRLVVRASRCGRDNPGSTPGVYMNFLMHTCRIATMSSIEVEGLDVSMDAFLFQNVSGTSWTLVKHFRSLGGRLPRPQAVSMCRGRPASSTPGETCTCRAEGFGAHVGTGRRTSDKTHESHVAERSRNNIDNA